MATAKTEVYGRMSPGSSCILLTARWFAVVLLTLGWSGCGSNEPPPPEPATVTSSDGQATLNVPVGSLPEGVTPEDLQLVPLDVSQVVTVLDGGPAPMAAYELQPDGLQFNGPVTLTIRRPLTDFNRPMVVHHLSGANYDKVELISDLEIHAMDASTGEVAFEVTHFSTVVLDWALGLEYKSTPGRLDYKHFPVGPWDWTWTVTRTAGATRTIETHNVTIEITLTSLAWTVEGTAQGGGQVAPHTPFDAPEFWTVHTDVISQTLPVECEAPGPGHIFHDLNVEYPSHYKVTLPNGPVTEDTPTLRSRFAPNIFVNCDAEGISGCSEVEAKTDSAISVGQALGVPEEEFCGATAARLILELIHSSNEVEPKAVAHNHTTLKADAPIHIPYSTQDVDLKFNNTEFECGLGANGYTLCPDPAGVVPAGDFVILFALFEADIPLEDATNVYQYGFVFDSDGDAGNNYQASPAYPNDFFSGTDRWYEARYEPASGWSLAVTDASNGGFVSVVTTARIIIFENTMVLVVAASEFAVAKPDYRITAFRHTGDYGMSPPHDFDGSIWPSVADGLQSFP
jgi:hypothetical protein